MSENVLEFTDNNFDSEVLQSSQPVLVDFWAPWCGPCKMIAPTIKELATEFSGRARIGKINTDENPMVASSHGISAIPTLMLFKDGNVVERFVGVVAKTKLLASIEGQLS